MDATLIYTQDVTDMHIYGSGSDTSLSSRHSLLRQKVERRTESRYCSSDTKLEESNDQRAQRGEVLRA